MGELANLVVMMSANTVALEKGIAQAKSSMGGLGKTLGAALGGAGVGTVLSKLGGQLNEQADLMAQFAAETGASAEATNEAKKAMESLFKSHTQGRTEIAGTLTALGSLQGVMEDGSGAAKKLADQYLDFAKVARTDGASAVAAFDDVLDAWSLQATDATGIMDVLTKSHQEFGLNVTEATDTLAKMAPTFKALGQTQEDAVKWLNAFAASGIDAEGTMKAFTSATQKLTLVGEEGTRALEDIAGAFRLTQKDIDALLAMQPAQRFDFLTQALQEMSDPAQRAAAAIELFGTKGGTQLADALANTRGGLDDFGVSLEDAAGAASDAADELDSTWTAKLKLLQHEVGGTVLDLSSKLGPALMAFAAIGPKAGAALSGMAVVIVTQVIPALSAMTAETAVATGGISVLTAAAALFAVSYATNMHGVRDTTNEVLGYIGEHWRETATLIGQLMAGPAAPFKIAFEAFALDAWNVRTHIVDFFTALPGDIAKGMAGLGDKLISLLRAAWNQAISWMDTAFKIHLEGPSFGPLKAPDLDWDPDLSFLKLATGGIVTRPTLALLAERGPEAVVPLGGGAAGTTINNFNIDVGRDGVFLGDQREKRAIVDAILPEIKRRVG